MGFKRSCTWKYFLEYEGERAKCKRCDALISIKRGNVCNMSRHLKAKHPDIYAEVPRPTRKYVKKFISKSESIPNKPSSLTLRFKRHLKAKHPGFVGEAKPQRAAASPGPSSATSAHVSSGDQQFQSDNELPISGDEACIDTPRVRIVSHSFLTDTPQVMKVSPRKISQQASEDGSVPDPMSPDEHSLITQQLVRMIVKEFHPIDIVDRVEFREFVNMLNPRYVIPTRKELLTKHIPRLHRSVKSEIRAKLRQASAVSITIDKWSLRTVQSFLSVSAHFIAEDSSLTSALLECVELAQGYTDDEICRHLERIFSAWGIAHKITAVVTANAPNIVSAVEKGHWCHLPCMAHSLNSVVQDALLEIAELRGKCKSIVEYFKKSTFHSATLAETQKEINTQHVELKQDVITRWDSTYDMLKRLLASKVPIEASLIKLNAKGAFNLTDWVVMDRTCDILKIFAQATAEIANEKDINISKQHILINAIRLSLHKSNVKDEPREIIALTSKLVGGIDKHFSYLNENQLILESSLLDPRFKEHAFSNENIFENAYQHLIETASEIDLPQELVKPQKPDPAPSTSSVWFEFDEMVRASKSETNSTDRVLLELDKYIQEMIAPRKSNPITWWNDRKVCYPRLYRLMKERLCVVTSVPSQKVFSKDSMLLCRKSSKVPLLKMSQIVFLKFNLK